MKIHARLVQIWRSAAIVIAVGVMIVATPAAAAAQGEQVADPCTVLGVTVPSAMCTIGDVASVIGGVVDDVASDAVDALSDAVIAQITGLVNATVLVIAEAIDGIAVEMFTAASTWWIDVPPIIPSLDNLGDWSGAWSGLTSIFFTLGFFYSLVLVLTNMNGRPMLRYAGAVLTYVWVTALVVGVVQGLNEFAHILSSNLVSGAPELPDLAGLLLLSGTPLGFLVLIALLFISGLISLGFVIAQQVALVVAMFFAPLVAAGRAMPWTETWLPYWAGHVFALNLWLPAGAALWRIGMDVLTGGTIPSALMGTILIAMSGVSWLFITPFISRVLPGGSSGGGGGSLLGGAVVAASLVTK